MNVDSYVEHPSPAVAAFFDLDKTVIAKSSTLAFGRHFYKYGLIGRGDALRSVAGQLFYRIAGADHSQVERVGQGEGVRAVPRLVRRPAARVARAGLHAAAT